MACEVTKEDLTGEIKKSLLTIKRARPIDGSSVFIPSTIGSDQTFKSGLKDAVSTLMEQFRAKEYPNQVNIEYNDYGAIITINASEDLALDMTAQNIRDEVGNDFYMGDNALRFQEGMEDEAFSRHQFKNELRPVTDNFVEYVNFKNTQLEKTVVALSQLHRDKRNPKKNIKEVLEKITKLSNTRAKIQNDIEYLKTNQIPLMFSALTDEIDNLNENLDNISMHNREDIKSRLDFLHKFVKGRSIDSQEKSDIESLRNFKDPAFDRVTLAVDLLVAKYDDKLDEIRQQVLESDISYVNNVQNNPNFSEEDIAAMFENKDDINVLEKTFLGITNSSNSDGILPQVLKSILETKTAIRKAEVKKYKDRLRSAVDKLGNIDFSFVFEKSRGGVNTGKLISLFSPLFQEKLREYMDISNNEDATDAEKYTDKVKWLKTNTDVIDFRKLKSVQQLYGLEYEGYFEFDDATMEAYEADLKQKLGPLFDEEMKKVINNLEIFQEEKMNYLQDSTNSFTNRNIARIDPWAFISNYNSPHSMEGIPYTAGGNTVHQVYSNIDNISFIPKKDVFVTFNSSLGEEIYQDSGYYNPDFEAIANDPNKLEYWKVLKEIYADYINPTYDQKDSNNMSYAKFEKEWIESLYSTSGLLHKTSNLYKNSKRGLQKLFYEANGNSDRDGIINNYGDSSKYEIFQFEKALMQKEMSELLEIAKAEGINTNLMTKKQVVKEIATTKVVSQYSMDINKITGALLDKTAEQKAKEDTLPVADIIFEAHKKIRTADGRRERERSNKRLENWINRVIKNQNEKYEGREKLLDKGLGENTKLLKESEKELLAYLQETKKKGHNKNEVQRFTLDGETYSLQRDSKKKLIYLKISGEEIFDISEGVFEEAFQKNIENQIQELGLDLTAAGMIQGVQKGIIIKGLGLNPVSGVFNRIEGKNSGIIMDMTGKYWTKGNIDKANSFMAFSNFIKFLPERMKPSEAKKVLELKKLQAFIDNVDLIQDRKNELERQGQTGANPGFNYADKLNLYQFAVDNPEFKNQGAILLSILMDTMITNPTTGEQVAIFNGKEFPAYDLVGGKLVLKPEFRSDSNISNWEDFEVDEKDITNNQFFLTRNKIKNTISRSQGNYDNLDVIDATRTIWGRSLTLFMKWMPEHAMQRFGAGGDIDISTGQTKLKGRYRSLMENTPALALTGFLGLTTTFGLTMATLPLGIGLAGFVTYRYFKNKYSTKRVQKEIDNTAEFVAFTKSIVIETLNYPLQLVNISKTIPNNTYNKTNLSSEEAGNLIAVAKELGVKLTMLSIMIIGKSLTWDDDDDKESERRMLQNFIDNQFNRVINTLDVWTRPEAFLTDLQRFAFLKYLGDVSNLIVSMATLNEDKKLFQNFMKSTPVPRILHKTELPWQDKMEYQGNQWFDTMVKDNASDGEYSIKKNYRNLRTEIREELEERVKKSGLKGDQAKKMLKNLEKDYLPNKYKDESYFLATERIKRLNGKK